MDSHRTMPPPPKGILKNKSRDESSRFKDDWSDSRRHATDNGGYLGYGNQKLEQAAGVGSSHNLRQKLNEFIARKGELLFRPLSTDEIPLKDEQGTHRTTQDHYGVVPALDFFLPLDPGARRRHFFNTVREGEILVASLESKTIPGLHLKVICMEGGRGLVLDDLGIQAFCPTNQMVPPIDPKNPNRIFAAADFVRCEILKVSPESERIVVGMKGNRLSPELLHSYQLGLIFEHELPSEYTLAVRERGARDSGDKNSYEELLEKSVGFRNPNNIVHLASCMGILNHKSTLMAGLSGVFPAKEMAKDLRRIQNGKWAHGSVAEGIRYFKSGNYTEAFQCLNKAISIDAENVEGLVARGALYANKAGFEKAIEDFESALRFNPSHYNARKYLAETLCAFAKQHETSGNIDDAVAAYSKCLVVRPDHGVAKEALWAIYARTEKLDVSLMSGPAALKTAELKEKLKLLLQDDIAVVKDSLSGRSDKKKSKKDRKSRRDSSDSDSSVSSSSESDSDSSNSSDSDSKGKKKKKSRKKKSKKSKRPKKDQMKEKEKERSLSPFSKRLAEHGAAGMGLQGGSDFVGFNQSTYAEWGKRVGVAEVGDSEEEKKSKKDKKKSRKSKERRKRRKHDSDSSSSESSDEDLKRKRSKAPESNAPAAAQTVLPDLGDLEAKLTAYYSKVEQEKATLVKPPGTAETKHSRGHGSREADSRSSARERHQREQVTSTRMEPQGQGFTLGKIQLNTDQYGNFIHPENIVRTVVNDKVEVEDVKPKFEMKFRSQGSTSGAMQTQNQEQTESGSKWRTVGVPPARDEPSYIVTRLDGSIVVRTEGEAGSKPMKSAFGIDHSISNPLDDSKVKDKEEPRNYRSRKSSGSRSRSRSPRGRRRRRSRSRSRSRGNRSSRSSDSRSRSRSRSPGYRSRRYFGRGRRFFRGFRHDRGGRGFYRGRGRGGFRPPDSRMRNVFNRSRSRSRSRGRASKSKSRSRSPRRVERNRSHSRDRDSKRADHRRSDNKERKDHSKPEVKEPEVVTVSDDPPKAASTSEIQVGGLTTTKAKDVEQLLDQRNAQKKEEMRERNPEFFRAS